jgi:hypothetical protein
MARKKAKIGRPPRHGGERLSKSRTFRVRPHLDELLQKAAAEAGRSVSEEIEYRLDRSFYEDALPARMVTALRSISLQLRAFEDAHGRPAKDEQEIRAWLDSPQGVAGVEKTTELWTKRRSSVQK